MPHVSKLSVPNIGGRSHGLDAPFPHRTPECVLHSLGCGAGSSRGTCRRPKADFRLQEVIMERVLSGENERIR